MNPEQAAFAAQIFLPGLEREFDTTKKVLAAVTESGKNYRPDPNSRTAFELASHIASSDVWFLNGIAKGEFARGGEEKPFASVAEIVAFYEKEFPAALAKEGAPAGQAGQGRARVRSV
jgi:hypothetical protein